MSALRGLVMASLLAVGGCTEWFTAPAANDAATPATVGEVVNGVVGEDDDGAPAGCCHLPKPLGAAPINGVVAEADCATAGGTWTPGPECRRVCCAVPKTGCAEGEWCVEKFQKTTWHDCLVVGASSAVPGARCEPDATTERGVLLLKDEPTCCLHKGKKVDLDRDACVAAVIKHVWTRDPKCSDEPAAEEKLPAVTVPGPSRAQGGYWREGSDRTQTGEQK